MTFNMRITLMAAVMLSAFIAVAPASRAADVPACVDDSTKATCKSYMYPDAAAEQDITDMCDMMSDMSGCTIRNLCKAGSLKGKYCTPVAILAALCVDMPSMSPCSSYNALCKPTSVVQQCKDQAAPPSLPTTLPTRALILEACGNHAMPSCDKCKEGPNNCPDPLSTFSALCHEHPSMPECASFFTFCSATGSAMSALCASSREYLPSMKMYFHQRLADIILWKEWIPTSKGAYAGSMVAVMCFALLSQALKVARLLLEGRWLQQARAAPRGCASPCAPLAPLPPKSDEGAPKQPGALKKLLGSCCMSSGQLRRSTIRSLFQGAASVLDYFSMLVVMTFNVGLCIAVVVGYMLGTLLFSHLLEQQPAELQAGAAAFGGTITATAGQVEEEDSPCCCAANLELGCGC